MSCGVPPAGPLLAGPGRSPCWASWRRSLRCWWCTSGTGGCGCWGLTGDLHRSLTALFRWSVPTKPESTDGRREGWANWDEGAYKGESLGSIGTDVTRQRVFSSRTGPRERSMEAGNRVIVRSDAAGCTRGSGGREFGGVGSVADSAVRLGVGWLAVGPGREWPAQPRASPGEDAK